MLGALVVAAGAGSLSPASAATPPPPTGSFASVSVGNGFGCAIRTDTALACWGFNPNGTLSPPPGSFASVSVAIGFACAIRTDATLACWGDSQFDATRLTPPPGTFTSVSAGTNHACAVRTDSTAACWGQNGAGGTAPSPSGTFISISAGDFFDCGVRTDAALTCWGSFGGGKTPPPTGTFRSVSAAYGGANRRLACAIRTDTTVACWDYRGAYYGSDGAPAPPGSFASISVGAEFACGVRTDGALACQNYGADSRYGVPPAGTYRSVSSGNLFSCAIRTDAALVCWPGASQAGAMGAPPPPPPAEPGPATLTPISAAKAFSLPSAAKCLSRRTFTIRIRKLPGITFVGAVVKVRGKRVKTVKRSRITAPVNLVGLPKGRFTVSITATASDGRTVTGKRIYHTCKAAKRPARGPKL